MVIQISPKIVQVRLLNRNVLEQNINKNRLGGVLSDGVHHVKQSRITIPTIYLISAKKQTKKTCLKHKFHVNI